jgi:hypothetical protein
MAQFISADPQRPLNLRAAFGVASAFAVGPQKVQHLFFTHDRSPFRSTFSEKERKKKGRRPFRKNGPCFNSILTILQKKNQDICIS